MLFILNDDSLSPDFLPRNKIKAQNLFGGSRICEILPPVRTIVASVEGIESDPEVEAIDIEVVKMINPQALLEALTLSVVIAATIGVRAQDDISRDQPSGLSFRYERSARDTKTIRQFEGKVDSVEGVVHVCATIQMGPANPIRYVDGLPEWQPAGDVVEINKSQVPTFTRETVPGGFEIQEHEPLPDGHPQLLEVIALGTRRDGKFTPAVRFGLGNDGRGEKMAHVNCWISDGRIDYFAPFTRPNTPYDFKLQVDLKNKRLSAWVSGWGDDDWFPVAEDVILHSDSPKIDWVQVEMTPDAPPIEGLQLRTEPAPGSESVRPHPLAKQNRVVDVERGFRFQSLRSTWRIPGKHVTIFREPGVHAGFPDVTLAGKDHLVCVWRNSSHTGGSGNGGGLSVAHSYDLGQTWGRPESVPTPAGVYQNCPRLQRLNDGALLMLVDVPSGGDQTVATWDVLLRDSRDEGKTWINERWLRAKEVGGGGGIVPSRVAEMDDGSWLLAASYFAKPGNVEILDYYRSKDRGKTWEFIGQPHHFPPHSLSEPSPIQLADGRLFVIARESRVDGLQGAKGFSTDGGKSWKYQYVPFPITGRTCAGLLQDGRLMVTFRSGVGRAALRAWIGDVDDPTGPQPAGGHCNDRYSIGLKDGVFHLDNDGHRGQFTMYNLRPADSAKTIVDLTFEVLVRANAGRAASVSVPFAGVLRLFPDHVVMAHNPQLRAEIAPGEFHTYRVVSRTGRMELFIDGRPAWDTDQGDSRLSELPWTLISSHALAFGNEPRNPYEVFGYDYYRFKVQHPDLYAVQISPSVTGYSQWRRFEAVTEDPAAGRHVTSWSAAHDGFPDQHQLDHIVEVEASANGHEQGYSGWVQLGDGRIFVVHYTDDTAAASSANPHMFGVPWIRGTFLSLDDLPPRKLGDSK